MIASIFLKVKAFEATKTRMILKTFTCIRRICQDIVMFVLLDPARVEASGCRRQRQEYGTAADESMVNIDADILHP